MRRTPHVEDTDRFVRRRLDREAALPRALGSYMLLERLGEGGMGQVFIAQRSEEEASELCVVKTILDDVTDDPTYVHRFIREAKLVVQLEHPSICRVFDVGRVGETYYMAMELVRGRDLLHVLRRCAKEKRALPLPVVVRVVADVLAALEHAHTHCDVRSGAPLAIVHRDVTPSNVLLGFDGKTRLIDFGVARVTDGGAHQTQPGHVIGKQGYVAPEQIAGHVVDQRADVFSAGVVLYEALVSERYYRGVPAPKVWLVACDEEYRPRLLTSLPAPLRSVVERATAVLAERRFASCAAMSDALLDAVGVEPAALDDVRATLEERLPGERAELEQRLEMLRRSRAAGPAAGAEATTTFARALLSRGPEQTERLSLGSGSLRGATFLSGATIASTSDDRTVLADEPTSVTAESRGAWLPPPRETRAAPLALDDDERAPPLPSMAPLLLASPAVGALSPARRSRRLPLVAAAGASLLVGAAVLAAYLAVEKVGVAADPSTSAALASATTGADASRASTAEAVASAPTAEPAGSAPPLDVEEPAPDPSPAPAPRPPVVEREDPPAARRAPRRARAPVPLEPPPDVPLTTLTEKHRYLSRWCTAQAKCAASLVARGASFAGMTTEEARAHRAAVDECVRSCRE